MQIGFGFDLHPFQTGRKLVLGGVEIPFPRGLAGHSDADVLLHAIGDALLGAVGLGDLGQHFPDHDPQYQGISSLLLLEKIREKLNREKWKINNIDTVILAETPKLSPYYEKMKEQIATVLKIKTSQVNIKATTMERLGPIGQGQAIAAYAVAMIFK
jgi:2-C-methyl-D-erythritol 2,4-cyclodiphosphate synthase